MDGGMEREGKREGVREERREGGGRIEALSFTAIQFTFYFELSWR